MDKRDIWDDHWEGLEEATVINPAQKYRHKVLLDAISLISGTQNKDNNTIYDFGSGQGDLVSLLFNNIPNKKFVGLELSQVGVDISKNKTPSADFYKCNLLDDSNQLEFLFGGASLGICAEVLEHLDNPEVMLRNIKKYINHNGTLVVTVPSGPMNEFEKSIGHRRHYTKRQLEDLMNNSGYKVQIIKQAGFPFFNLYKIAGLLRGKKVMNDAKARAGGGLFFKAVLKCFDILFKMNLTNSSFGWQLIAIAKVK